MILFDSNIFCVIRKYLFWFAWTFYFDFKLCDFCGRWC